MYLGRQGNPQPQTSHTTLCLPQERHQNLQYELARHAAALAIWLVIAAFLISVAGNVFISLYTLFASERSQHSLSTTTTQLASAQRSCTTKHSNLAIFQVLCQSQPNKMPSTFILLAPMQMLMVPHLASASSSRRRTSTLLPQVNSAP